MRKAAFLLLLASVSAPSLAQDRDSEREARREAARAERAERAAAREERREERQAQAERSEPRQERSIDRNDADRAALREQRREDRDQRVKDRRADRQFAPDGPRPTLEQRREARDDARDLRQQQRIERRAERRAPPLPVSTVPRPGTQPPLAFNPQGRSTRHWSGNWRNDRRYDWYNWRNRNRSIFRLGLYFDPFGWGYRPYSIGWRLWPSYYSRNYWLNDPWMYRLPPAYPGTRWVRYYNDAVLVDTWTGEVVDVIYSFFW